MPEEVAEEISKFQSALRKCFKKSGQSVVFFERNYKQHHMQLQAVPLALEADPKPVFLDVAESQGLEMTEVPEHARLDQMAQPGTPYFYAEMAQGQR